MVTLRQRTYRKELLDGPGIPFPDIRRNMKELEVINRYLGGHRITVAGLHLLAKRIDHRKQPIRILEIGCGGGDNLRAIAAWAKDQQIPVQLTGIDINGECVAFARETNSLPPIQFIHSDYQDASFRVKPDIVFSSLFCHHFTERQLVQMLWWMYNNSTTGFFINDLHRHWLAYYSIKLLTQLFSKSYLVKNDAPLSVQRGFKKTDWKHLFDVAGLKTLRCQWKWAFRWLVVCAHDNER